MDYDLIVVGLGPGGEAVAGSVAEAGRSVLGLDPRLVGGECPYFGCIPSKMVLRGAELLHDVALVEGVAGHASAEPDFTPVANRIRDEATDDWDDQVAVDRFEGKGGTFARVAGRLAGRDERGRLLVQAGDETHSAAAVCISTGTAPAIPPVPGLRDVEPSLDGPVWTNQQVLRTRTVPGSIIVLGGGAIGCELAQGLRRFGAEVTLVEAAPHLLMPEEPEAGAVIADVFAREGITVHADCGAEKVEFPEGGGVTVTLADGGTVHAEKILVAAGRKPHLDDIGLETVGLDPKARTLDVDEHLAVQGVDGLYAVGDVTGKGAFTHVAVWQASVLTAHLLGQDEHFGGYHGLAWATFTDPEVGRVGLTEAQARERGLTVRVGTQQVSHNARGWIHGPGNDGFIKVVEDVDRGVLVGATVVAPNGGEILGALTLAVHAEVEVERLRTMHYAYPTIHRGIGEAIQALA